jgi:hypothetical protein
MKKAWSNFCTCFMSLVLLVSLIYIPIRMHYSDFFEYTCSLFSFGNLNCIDLLFLIYAIYISKQFLNLHIYFEKRNRLHFIKKFNFRNNHYLV